MELRDRADLAGLSGPPEAAEELLVQAFSKEREAARRLTNNLGSEPSRSVLFRSAAALAMKCGRLREAEQLVCEGLAGNPPDEIAEELRDLFDEINYHRHLSVRGLELSPAELRMSLAGSAIGPGMAQKDEVIKRIERMATILYRTAQRTRNQSYTEKVPRGIKKDFEIEMSMAEAASFAIGFRISYRKEQLALPGMSWPEQVIDELMTCIDLWQNQNKTGLRARFQEEAYLVSFLGLSQSIAPDGDKVNYVGFTASKGGRERWVSLTKSAKDMEKLTASLVPPPKIERTSVRGRLLWADSTTRENRLRVVDESGKKQLIVVREGMGDIVRTLWEEEVIVTGDFDGKQIINAVVKQLP